MTMVLLRDSWLYHHHGIVVVITSIDIAITITTVTTITPAVNSIIIHDVSIINYVYRFEWNG